MENCILNITQYMGLDLYMNLAGDRLNNIRKLNKKKERRKKWFYIIIILIITLYFSSQIVPLLNASTQSTYVIEYGKIEKTIETIGYVAREEKCLLPLMMVI